MPAPRPRQVGTLIGVLLASLVPAANAASDRNTTGLPTYPHIGHAIMDPVPRDTLGSRCIHYAADSADPLATVEAWYRNSMPGATESDVNRNSLYGDFFKLTGIRLTLGNDFVTVYRTQNSKSTAIEIFKCAGPGNRPEHAD